MDSIGVSNPLLSDMIGYDGNLLSRNTNTQRLAGNLVDAMLKEAQSLSNQKTTKTYFSEGINKPEHEGLVYSYGQRDITQRLFPTAGDIIHTKYAVYGTDCSGLMINLIRKAGINIPNTDVEHFESTLRSALTSNSTYSSLKLENLGNIPTSKMKSGDFILWINPPSERHIGIISTVINSETLIFQSNGEPKPETEANQQKNLGLNRGVHPISLNKAVIGNVYWGPDYKILRLEDPSQIITDIDGNVYKAVIIGTQVWMIENLRTTRYRNGDQIPHVTSNIQWANLSAGAYCNYNNDVNNVGNYGHLYNWYAVSDLRNIAPIGWHVATNAEWTTLINYLGGYAVAGGSMKEIGTTHWQNQNVGATNSSGFTGLPGGYRVIDGSFNLFGTNSTWWSSTEDISTKAWDFGLHNLSTIVSRFNDNKQYGFYVRCIKD